VNKHVTLPTSEVVRCLGGIVIDESGGLHLAPTIQGCDCQIRAGNFNDIFVVALCDKHEYLATAEGRLRKRNT
jgi:hypothetical protein